MRGLGRAERAEPGRPDESHSLAGRAVSVLLLLAGGDQASREAKFWLEPETELARSYGFTERDLRRIWMIINERQTEIRDAWNRHFGG